MNSFGLGLVLNFTDNATSGMYNATRVFQQMSSMADELSSSVSGSITDLVTASYALDTVGSRIANVGTSIISLYSDVSQSVIDSGMQMQGYRMQLSALYGSVEAGEEKIQEIKDYAMSSVFDIQSLIPAITTMKAVGIEAMEELTTSSGKHTQKLLDYASDIAAMVPNMRNTYGTGVQAAMGAMKEYIAEGNELTMKRSAGLDITGILGESKGSTMEERAQQVADLVEQLNIVGYTAQLAGTPTQRLSNMQDALFNSLTKIADGGVFDKYCDLLEKLSNWVFSLVENEETFNTITGVLADTITTFLSPLESMLDFIIENSNKMIEWVKDNEELAKKILLVVAGVGAFLIVGGLFLKLLAAVGYASVGLSYLSKLPVLLSGIGRQFGLLAIKAAPFVALAGLAYLAWSENLFGIKDRVTETIRDIGSIFSILSDAWGDNTLSEENFQKANELGILPFVGGLLQLKYYWDFLVEGFKNGFVSFFRGIETVLEKLGILDIDFSALIEDFGEFLASLVEIGAEDKWTNIGENLGKIAGALITIAIASKALNGVITLITTIGTIFSKVGGVFSTVGSVIMTILSAIGAALGIPAALVGALIVLLISSAITLYEKLGEIAGYIVTTLFDIFGGIFTVFTGIIDFFRGVFTGDWKMAWEGICSIFEGIWETLKGIVKGVVNGIILIINTLIDVLYRVLAGVVNGVGSIFGFIAGALGFEDAGFSIPETPPQIPYLADGGVAVKATPAVVGDGDEKEAILPLNTKVFSEIAKGIFNQKPVQSQQPVRNDYSVTFSAGSVVIQLANSSEAELERVADKLMKIIARKQKLRAMAIRAKEVQA